MTIKAQIPARQRVLDAYERWRDEGPDPADVVLVYTDDDVHPVPVQEGTATFTADRDTTVLRTLARDAGRLVARDEKIVLRAGDTLTIRTAP